MASREKGARPIRPVLRPLLLCAGLAALLACDPYSKARSGPAHVVDVLATGSGLGPVDGGYDGATGRWSVTVPWSCVLDTQTGLPVLATGRWVIFVRFDQLLDGESIQSGVDDCTPPSPPGPLAGAPPGLEWFTCYSPSAPTPDLGGAVVVYAGTQSISAMQGWFDLASPLPASNTDVATYPIDDPIRDKTGRTVDIPVDVVVLPDAGAPAAAPAVTGIGSTSLTVDWSSAPAACAAANTVYSVEVAPDAGGVAGDFLPVESGGSTLWVAGPSLPVTGLAPDTAYWFRVRAGVDVAGTVYPGSSGDPAPATTLP